MKRKVKIDKNHFRVAIFGSARLKKNNPNYKLVYNLAKMVAKENIDVVTGGGPGLMEAASRGHAAGRGNNGTHSIGLTIKLPQEQRDAVCLDIKKDFDKFSHRLDNFMELSNVVVVAPGGIGTILEFFYTWQLIQVKHICEIPVIMLGSMWNGLLTWVKNQPLKNKLMSKEDLDSIIVVNSYVDAMKIIKQAKQKFERGENVCKNLKL